MRNACMPYPDNRVSLAHNPRPGPHQSHHILLWMRMYSRSRSRRT